MTNPWQQIAFTPQSPPILLNMPKFEFVWYFFIIRVQLGNLQHEYHKIYFVSFSEHYARRYMIFICLITGSVNFNHLVQMIWARFLAHITQYHIVGQTETMYSVLFLILLSTLKLCKMPFLIILSCTNFSIHQ